MEAETTAVHLRARSRSWQWRKVKDVLMRRIVQFGGVSVIIAIALIFVFLLSVVYPLFQAPSTQQIANYVVPGDANSETLYLAIEEQAEIGMRLSNTGEVLFFDVQNGDILKQHTLPISADNPIKSYRVLNETLGIIVVGLQSGDLLFFRHHYQLEFTDTRRIIHPKLSYPFGEELFNVVDGPLFKFGIGENEDSISIMAHTNNNRIFFKYFEKESSFLDDEVTLVPSDAIPLNPIANVLGVLVNPEQEWAYVLDRTGSLQTFDIRNKNKPSLQENVQVTMDGVVPTSLAYLTGGISLLIGDSAGNLSQWFKVRSKGNLPFTLTKIREFEVGSSPVITIVAEQLRKGVIAATEAGKIKLLYTTSERDLLSFSADDRAIDQLAVAPRADIFMAENDTGKVKVWHINNHHPESSMQALWGKIWYEDYLQPDYIWQSSSASSDFEPKFSLVPLTFGTIKAAFYAMLFAMPLAICGAIFTAYFMAPRMRGVVKPTIEIMEALPTVILGFLAGLWLAPYVELHLPGVFSVFLLAPLGVILVALLWWNLPARWKMYIPDGWQAAILIIPIIVITWICLSVSPYVERWLFDGDIRIWMNESLGIGFDQRNALIIGIAMGFAVIPTIFSIAEDAIFSVPKHLTSGSLALGATPWQSLVRVVLPSASPGIFSAVMIGFGRAVGETMIVLMATGNTPVMDFSIFQGYAYIIGKYRGRIARVRSE